MPNSSPRLRSLHINRMIPNVLTLLALAAGLTALRFALAGRWEHAILAIVVAGILDGLDGRIARILKGSSKFGAELDSLSDFLCFGVAPALILYLWSLREAGRAAWWLVLLLCICCALRLARFNTDIEEEHQPAWNRQFFIGMPSPAGAGFVLLPMLFWFQLEADFLRHPAFVGLFMLVGAFLLVSRFRTFTFKRMKIGYNWLLPTMLGIGVYLASLLSDPWLTLAVTEIAYVTSIPFSERQYRRLARKDAAALDQHRAADADDSASPRPPT